MINEFIRLGERKDFESMKTLIDRGFDINTEDKDKRTALNYFLVDVHCLTQYKEKELDYTDVIQFLIDNGIDVNHVDYGLWTPLHFAAQRKNFKAMKLLIDAGANVNAKEKHGNTPIGKAAYGASNNWDCVLLLLNSGADPFIKNKYGVSTRDFAETIGSEELIDIFDSWKKKH